MLDFKMKVVDTQDPKVRKVFVDPLVKSRGALALLSKIWNLKHSELSSFRNIISGKGQQAILPEIGHNITLFDTSRDPFKRQEADRLLNVADRKCQSLKGLKRVSQFVSTS